MNDCMIDVFNRVAEEAGRLTQHGKHATLTSREVQVRAGQPGAGRPPDRAAGTCMGRWTSLPPLPAPKGSSP